jgi:prepilin-type N-terminal cleavage/methylation domain-containing protein
MNVGHTFRLGRSGAKADGFTLLETLIVIVVMAVIATVVIVRLPEFASSEARTVATMMRQFAIASDHATLTARPVEVRARARGLEFNELRAGRWTAIDSTGVSLDVAERLVMVNVTDGRIVTTTQRVRVDELGRWPLLDIELYQGSRQVRAFRIGG